MILAQKGLPHSGNVGDELYDKLGSLGLTSFMQEVTRVRALEGELARTIQMMRGVKAARVHVVLGDEGSFRRERQPPSASVIIRGDGFDAHATGLAIRQLVAAAVPGMKPEEVTVLDVDGQLLASGSDSLDERARQSAGAADERFARHPGFDHPHAGALSEPAQFPGQRRREAQRRQDPDQRDRLRSRQVGATQRPGDQGEAELAEHRRRLAGRRSGQSAQTTERRQRHQAIQRRHRQEGGTDQLRGVFEIGDRRQPGLHRQGPFGGVALNRAALAASLGDKPDQAAIDKRSRTSSSSPRRPPASTRRAATRSRSRWSISPTPPRTWSQRRDRVSWNCWSASSARSSPPWRCSAVGGLADPVRRATADQGAPRRAHGSRRSAGSRRPPRSKGRHSRCATPGATSPGAAGFGEMGGDDNLLLNSSDGRDAFLDALRERRDNGAKQKLQKLVDFDEEHAARVLKQWIKQGAGA